MDDGRFDNFIKYVPNRTPKAKLPKGIYLYWREENNNKAFIGQRIARRRNELGIPQTHLARLLGVTRELISMIESGRAEVNAGDLPLYAKFLRVPTAYFIDMDEQSVKALDPTDPQRHKIADLLILFRRLPEPFQEAVLRGAKAFYDTLNPIQTNEDDESDDDL